MFSDQSDNSVCVCVCVCEPVCYLYEAQFQIQSILSEGISAMERSLKLKEAEKDLIPNTHALSEVVFNMCVEFVFAQPLG